MRNIIKFEYKKSGFANIAIGKTKYFEMDAWQQIPLAL
jgi:hypothetical protein